MKCKLSTDGMLIFWCPGCDEAHAIGVTDSRTGPKWDWNGSLERPTCQPSIKVTSNRYGPEKESFRKFKGEFAGAELSKHVCHSFIRDGNIEYCGDSDHELAGKTVELPDFDAELFGVEVE